MAVQRRHPHAAHSVLADDAPDPGVPEQPSKTRLKQRMHALQALGERLVTLSDARLATVPIDESLRDAVIMARGVRSHEGRRRQMQYLGRLMRTADADAIEAALAGDDAHHHREVGIHHAAEHWRDGLIDGRLQLEGWLERFPPTADELRDGAATTLDRLVTMARDAAASGRSDPKHARALYRALHRWLLDR